MAKVGRPPKISEIDMPELVRKFSDYIDENDIPIIQGFCWRNGISKNYLYDRQEFSELLKKAIAKKEEALELKALAGEVNSTMAIFSLKQLGWKDKEAKIVFVDPKTLTDKELKEMIDNGS